VNTRQIHRGRLLDHLHLVVRDLDASKRFYAAVLGSLGRELSGEGEGYFYADELFVSLPPEGVAPGRVHFALQAASEEEVRHFHAAALAAGGTDHGAPGLRPQYHPAYYAAFVLDPDGNNVEAVWHGPHRRSAPSVLLEWDA
jgi:catechol 2,3-dioxygenase-like lactoylglutathione lyase family enzyme